MARRRTSLVEDIFGILLQLPWWGGLVLAGIFWFIGPIFLAWTGTEPNQNAMRPISTIIFKGLAILSLVAAGGSAIKSLSRKKLLDSQSGIDSLRRLSWREFERLVGEAYRRQGYDIEETGGGGADGGIDLILRGNGETVLVQCKHWKTRSVGVDKTRELFGVLADSSADRAFLVTTGNFTNEARNFANGKPLILIAGPTLAHLVSTVKSGSRGAEGMPAPLSSVSTPDCSRCGSPMVLRTASRGSNAGSQFYGCSRYPQCRGSRPAN